MKETKNKKQSASKKQQKYECESCGKTSSKQDECCGEEMKGC